MCNKIKNFFGTICPTGWVLILLLMIGISVFASVNVVDQTANTTIAGHILQYTIDDDGEIHPVKGDASGVPSTLSNKKYRVEYNADGTVLYMGYVDRGVAESTDSWLIYKFTYDANQQVTLRESATDSWDNRNSAVYG